MRALLVGALSGAVYWSFYRVFTVKFPLNFISPTYGSLPLFGIPLGLALAQRRPTLGRAAAWWLAAGLFLFVVSALAYKDKSVHYLLFGAYYDYPAPTSTWITLGLLASVPLSMVPIVLATRAAALLPTETRGATVPALLLGVGVGVALAEGLTPACGAYAILIVVSALIAAWLPRWTTAAAAGAAIVVAGVVLYNPPEAIFTWRLREYKRLETFWTHHYKWDWIEFDNGHCLGGIHNEIMVHYSCDDAEKLPLTHLRMAEAISDGPIARERVASVGRPDGVIAGAHRARNPHLKRFVAVENDARVVDDVLHHYSKYEGNIFTSNPNFELVASDNRLWIEGTHEKFDALYIDGIGLMLVPFPFTVIQQENYVFSADSYRRIMDDLLTPDGILIVDRGTTSSGESKDLAGGLPPDVQVRTLYTKVPTYPLTGLPLVYILASRNGAELDRIVGELTKGNLYASDPFNAQDSYTWHRSTDDRPWFQPAAVYLMSALTLLFALLALLLMRAQIGWGLPREERLQFLLGVLFAAIGIWLPARGARAFIEGTQAGWTECFAALLGGAAAGFAFTRGRSPSRRLGLASITAAAGFGAGMALPFSASAALASCGVGGCALGALLASARPSARGAPAGLVLVLGIVVGIYVFQAAVLVAGFRMLAVALTLALVALTLRAWGAPVRAMNLAPTTQPG